MKYKTYRESQEEKDLEDSLDMDKEIMDGDRIITS